MWLVGEIKTKRDTFDSLIVKEKDFIVYNLPEMASETDVQDIEYKTRYYAEHREKIRLDFYYHWPAVECPSVPWACLIPWTGFAWITDDLESTTPLNMFYL